MWDKLSDFMMKFLPQKGAPIGLENTDEIIVFHIANIPINMTIFSTWIVMGILVFLSWLATRHLKDTIRVSRFQTFMEIIVNFLRSEIKDISNDNPRKYMGLVMGFFMFIAMSNLLTIIPWFRPPTASLSTAGAFGLVVFFAIPFYAIRNAGFKGYIKKFIDPSPVMLPMNIFSDFASALSMAFRLFGNMLSGVMFATILTAFIPFIMPLTMQSLGLLTGTIQAYIFALLAIVYTSNVAPEVPYVEENYLLNKKGEK